MKRLAMMSMLGVALATGLGCGVQSEKGGPGAVSTTVDDAARTFTITVPRLDVNVKPGETRDVQIDVNRGDQFNQQVTLRFDAPAGVTVSPQEVTVAADEKQASITIEAAPDARIAAHTVNVTALPETGKEVTSHFNVAVNERVTSRPDTFQPTL